MMFLLKDRSSLKSQLSVSGSTVFHHTVVFLLLTHLCGGNSQSQVTGSPQPIVAIAGDDVILPCNLEPATDASGMTVEWARPDLNPRFVHVWRDGQELEDRRHPYYQKRTSLFTDKLKFGDVSLKITKVKLSDEGTYRCFIPSLSTETMIQLLVGSVSSPVIEITKSSSGVVLECECKGWYPEPELFWLDGEGNILSAGPAETVRGPDGLYTVSSRVTVEKTDTNSFTCRAQQHKIHQTKETQIQIQKDLFMDTSGCLAAHITIAVAVVMCVALIVFLVYTWKKGKVDIRRWARENKMCQALCPLKKCSMATETETPGAEPKDNTPTGDPAERQSLMEGKDTEQTNTGSRAINLDTKKAKRLEEQKAELEKEIEKLKSELKEEKRQREEKEGKLKETGKQKEAAEKKNHEYKELLKKTSKGLTDRRSDVEKWINASKKPEKKEMMEKALKEIKELFDEIQQKL